MKFSELWLREWVNPAIDSAALAEQITMAGMEVDGVEPVAGRFTGVVVGQIVECQPHPNADKLRVTKVDIGSKQWLNIVCGAPNCRTGLRVAVATIGALLPGDFKIKAAKLRGEPSEGMLCSFVELGIAGDYDGIIELPDDAPIGQDIRDYLKLDDNTIDISVTPNRADCLGLLGIARDVAVRNRMPLMHPIIETVAPVIGDTLSISVDAPDACPRYLGRVVKNIDVSAPTPLWMKEKLRRCNLRSVDAVVDITNFVLLELGQPMHAFDYNRIEGGIVVRYAGQDEELILLDGSDVKLSPDTLVIADHSKVLAMAGIFGGVASSINPMTRDVVLECAFFQPLAIIGRARRYGLHTDASHRYERGVDPALQPRAMERATALLVAICGGQPGPVIDVTSSAVLAHPNNITLRRKTLDRLIGHVIPDEDVSDILTRLGCQVIRTKADWQALAPSWRFDMAIEEDLIEEIARVYGYDAIPNVPVRADLVMPHHREAALPLSRVKMLLVDRGYQEAITYSFVDPKNQALLHPHQSPLVLPSPISQDMSAMRLSLWTGLLGAVVYNQNRQQHRIRLFESGLRFLPDKEADLGIRQDLMLAGVIAGPRFDEHWDQTLQLVDFYDAKGDLEAILELTGKLDDIDFRAQRHPALHPGQSAAIYLNNEPIGFIGVIHPEFEAKLNLNGRTLVFELLWEKVAERKVPKANDISRFPANRRDIAVVVADDVAAADIIAECKKVIENKLVVVNLFDVYRGRGIAEGFKSLAISLILQDTVRTLKEEEIAATVARCVAALKQRFQASLRD
ncbi:phenylalanine--tRNA ligase beta subunit [Sodalis-like endosymbiont of Proechinophthirus fluctus]|uniref:phenylalanine--tRNA ligase subunit beta n=1 Tax=Sodalis-like endosymbiont of Proechinophthirus fluctus TaxID=1462730 RepID=UPI0007A805EF|nr:phenylalanine--tRNA ligase subunit beta [Sodalis-like endosymbiont of Proechinophthirus fluctus]KYP97470.1 phenylalanine--tRNA ligase beta subunit [Sodalis-like endosymbiont of Proechinophthirus fluctus]